MAYLSTTDPPDWAPGQMPARQPGSLELLLSYGDLLQAQPGPDAIAQRIAEQAHASFCPIPTALIAEENGRFYLRGFASQDERSDRPAIEQHLTQPHSLLITALRKTLNDDSSGLHAADLAGTGCDSVHTVPVMTTQSSAVLALFLNPGQRLTEEERTFVKALARIGAMALSGKELSQLFTRITRSSRQWSEMFDSISDFMLLHDEHQKIARVNRSLAEKLGKHPAAVLGFRVRDLFGLSSSAPSCPFC